MDMSVTNMLYEYEYEYERDMSICIRNSKRKEYLGLIVKVVTIYQCCCMYRNSLVLNFLIDITEKIFERTSTNRESSASTSSTPSV